MTISGHRIVVNCGLVKGEIRLKFLEVGYYCVSLQLPLTAVSVTVFIE